MQVDKSVRFQLAKRKSSLVQRKVGTSVAFSWQELVYELVEQNIIERIFKNTKSFVHREAAQRDFREWDIRWLYPSTLELSPASSASPRTWVITKIL